MDKKSSLRVAGEMGIWCNIPYTGDRLDSDVDAGSEAKGKLTIIGDYNQIDRNFLIQRPKTRSNWILENEYHSKTCSKSNGSTP